MWNKNGLESECEALTYPFIPINKYVNRYKQISDEPINKNVKDIINITADWKMVEIIAISIGQACM